MTQIVRPGINSSKFLDINDIEHHFSTELKSIGFPVTLLHNHKHTPPDHVLMFKKGFNRAEYQQRNIAEKENQCSWYLDGQEIVAYEFSEDKVDYDVQSVKQNLKILKQLGHQHYGTTRRTINNVIQLEIKDGHVYLARELFTKQINKVSQTVINGDKEDACGVVCVPGPHHDHCSFHG